MLAFITPFAISVIIIPMPISSDQRTCKLTFMNTTFECAENECKFAQHVIEELNLSNENMLMKCEDVKYDRKFVIVLIPSLLITICVMFIIFYKYEKLYFPESTSWYKKKIPICENKLPYNQLV